MKKKIFRKGIPFLIIVAIIAICFSAFNKNDTVVILDNSNKSSFVDFYTEDDKVYIECVLNIYANEKTEVTITATDTDNVKIGLLESPVLTGIDKTDGDRTFKLKGGENEVTVLFEGDYAGIYQISAREIPRFIEIKVK